jgi:hypothetical protein
VDDPPPKLILQLGGAQDAVMDAPPGLLLVTAPALLTFATPWLEVQVNGMPVIVRWFESRTVGVTVKPVPLVPVNVVPPELKASVMDWTGQVVNVCSGLVKPIVPFVLLIEAEMTVVPGTLAVACI